MKAAPTELGLTRDEQINVRTGLKYFRTKVGGWTVLGRALHLAEGTVRVAAKGGRVSPELAFRLAKFAQVPVDEILTGRFPDPRTCPHCGMRQEEKEADGTNVGDDATNLPRSTSAYSTCRPAR